ncbi:MAG: DUF1127 domain-containing protein [Alphaproteobacteria bacterium]|nr:DUF1127 domain-containing protein [Alphaproteobacteria bacterium]
MGSAVRCLRKPCPTPRRACAVRARADRARQRRRLAEMSDRELKDIGISRADALAEAEKSWLRSILSR